MTSPKFLPYLKDQVGSLLNGQEDWGIRMCIGRIRSTLLYLNVEGSNGIQRFRGFSFFDSYSGFETSPRFWFKIRFWVETSLNYILTLLQLWDLENVCVLVPWLIPKLFLSTWIPTEFGYKARGEKESLGVSVSWLKNREYLMRYTLLCLAC